MLFRSTSPGPKTNAGLRMAWDIPESRIASSTSPLPLKYGYGLSGLALVMLTWMRRFTPALRAASTRSFEFSAARPKSVPPRANLIQ